MKKQAELTLDHVRARYPQNVKSDDDMGQAWLSLRREMMRNAWAKTHGLKPEDVGIAVHPRTGKVYFQWKEALKYLPGADPAMLAEERTS